MIGWRIGLSTCAFVEISRVDGTAVKGRGPELPGADYSIPDFYINALENEDDLNTWYSRSRILLMAPMTGPVGARKVVSISGWAKHGFLYEFTTLAERGKYFADTEEARSQKVAANLIHRCVHPAWAPGSGLSLGDGVV